MGVDAVRDVAEHYGGTDVDTGFNLEEIDSLGLVEAPELITATTTRMMVTVMKS